MQKKIIIIIGITASGKSELCTYLAKKYNSVIINCDSKQIYKEIPIITAQPLKQEVPYRLYGYISVRESYSVGLWLQDVEKHIQSTWKNLQLPIITGGSGLYITSLVRGLSSIPQVSKEVRRNVQELSRNLSKKEFYKLVLSKDHRICSKITANDSHRLSRALEVIIETGKSIYFWQETTRSDMSNFEIYAILPERAHVYQKINSRFIKMIEEGAINEIRNLHNMNLDQNLPAMKAHGIPEIIQHLENKISLEEAINIAQINTRHYAKRQYTWFKNQLPESRIINKPEELHSIDLLGIY
ncbi:tRNA (adenosine(37)-N6)-dimethylallyltransferase MiaA [Wolbachia endosymbiont of Pentidionis agamae]|uniref:tRNA (adenosine(37)-N6)-dimethylallyltransferase MiaA n=1 Tax=Wolbachia endosymbiont of Pentidionis agamae TaxID=3110435 RepID=UPI002FD39583